MAEDIKIIKGDIEQQTTATALKQELSQYIQLDNLNFLLGSGCSSYIVDGIEKSIPTMIPLYQDFFKQNPEFTVGQVKVDNLFDNLEKLLEFMLSIETANSVISIDKDINEKIKQVKKYILNKVIQGLDSNEVLSIYKDFFMKLIRNTRKAPINIFTTNYDLYSEMALDELGFFYNDGFSGTYNRKFNPLCYNYALVDNMNLNKDVWDRVSNFFNIYKIHGSITWINENEQIREKDYKSIREDENIMIYPTPLKDRSTLMTPYSDLFRMMQNNLTKNNGVLFTCGYSFSDEHVNRVILNSLSIPTFKLIVFGYGDSIARLRQIRDNRIIIIYSEEKIHYFNRFIEELLPEIHEDIQDSINLINGNKAIKLFEEDAQNE